MVTMAELLERIQAATGPDRELDFLLQIHLACPLTGHEEYTLQDVMDDFALLGPEGMTIDAPYTASIDAALALMERVLPGWACGFDAGVKTRIAFVDKHDYADRIFGARYTAEAPTICLAILAATLTALISKEPS